MMTTLRSRPRCFPLHPLMILLPLRPSTLAFCLQMFVVYFSFACTILYVSYQNCWSPCIACMARTLKRKIPSSFNFKENHSINGTHFSMLRTLFLHASVKTHQRSHTTHPLRNFLSVSSHDVAKRIMYRRDQGPQNTFRELSLHLPVKNMRYWS